MYSLHDSLAHMLTVAARAQERHLESTLRDLGLTPTGWSVLIAVGCEEMTQPSDIAAYIKIDRTAASRALRQLEEAGLIQRESGTEDRRTTKVALTDKGRATLDMGMPKAAETNARLDAVLDRAEAAEIRRLLSKLIQDSNAA